MKDLIKILEDFGEDGAKAFDKKFKKYLDAAKKWNKVLKTMDEKMIEVDKEIQKMEDGEDDDLKEYSKWAVAPAK